MLHQYPTRQAVAEVTFALHDGTDTHIFTGSTHGSICTAPRGETGFGWDPIFIPDGYDKTWAEMNDDDKHATSMRREALHKLTRFLEQR